MEFLVDAHTHSIASGHAYSTIREMVKAASDMGLKAICITEHTLRLPDACHKSYFSNFKILPREMCGIEVFFGAENNIIDYEGNVDFEVDTDPKVFRGLDINIASMHMPWYPLGTVEENTRAVMGAMDNPYIDIIGHPDDGRIELDYEKLVKHAKKTGKLLEINNHSLDPVSVRYDGAYEKCRTILELCRDLDVEIITNTDAHADVQVGDFRYAKKVLEDMNFPERLIVNCDLDRFKSHINRFRNVLK